MTTIMLIDDDELMLELLGRTLERHGYRVLAFRSPLEALREFDNERPDVVVSDVQMPEMDGIEFAKAVLEMSSPVPVVLITAQPSDDIHARAQQVGVQRVLKKPLRNFSTLVSLIKDAVLAAQGGGEAPPAEDLGTDFLTQASHEMRTPLTAVKAALDGLDKAQGLSRAERELVRIGNQNIDRIGGLVDYWLAAIRAAVESARSVAEDCENAKADDADTPKIARDLEPV